MPYIPFKSNSQLWVLNDNANSTNDPVATESNLWRQMYAYYEFNHDWFMQQYHKRSNVESTFSMIKAKFGDGLEK